MFLSIDMVLTSIRCARQMLPKKHDHIHLYCTFILYNDTRREHKDDLVDPLFEVYIAVDYAALHTMLICFYYMR